jgi:hypothetical protein
MTAGGVASAATAAVDAVPAPSDENDPLAHLFKMSRTAGLGSGDYVAINTVAVTALVLGISGALVVVDSLFIVLPLAGLILGIIAWRQIRHSNGTQTGGLMAGLAILLSLGFLGAKVGKEGWQTIQRGQDKKEITGLIELFGQNVAAIDPGKPTDTTSHLDSDYGLFDEAFKSRVTRAQFDALWLEYWASPYYGPMASMHSDGVLKFDTDARSGDLVCASIAIAQFKRGEARWQMVFRQLNGKWYIEDMPEVFPTAPPPQQQSQQRR